MREPLVIDIVDTLDSVGLTVASIGSALTNGLIPKPDTLPDRERIEQLLNLLKLLTDRILSETSTTTINNNNNNIINNSTIKGIQLSYQTWERLRNLVIKILSIESSSSLSINKLQPVLIKLLPIATDVTSQLFERSVSRTVRTILSPNAIQSQLPLFSQTLDLITMISGQLSKNTKSNNK